MDNTFSTDQLALLGVNSKESSALVQRVCKGLREYGFLKVNLSKDEQSVFERAYEQSEAFFSLRNTIKQEFQSVVCNETVVSYRTENKHVKSKWEALDMLCGGDVGQQHISDRSTREWRRYSDAFQNLQETIGVISKNLLSVLDCYLYDNENTLMRALGNSPDSMLRATHYNPGGYTEDHIDHSLITAIHSPVPGFKVINGENHYVEEGFDNITVIVGEQLQGLLGEFSATVHEVEAPEGRNSFILFSGFSEKDFSSESFQQLADKAQRNQCVIG